MDSGTIKSNDYEAFLRDKAAIATRIGFDVDESEINPICKPHQRASVRWAIAGGCRALFESFGLGKSVQQIEICRIVVKKLTELDGKAHAAIVAAPLGVRQEFKRDAKMLGVDITFIRTTKEAQCGYCHGVATVPTGQTDEMTCPECGGRGVRAGLFITNYESIREGKIDLSLFDVISLDEASCLRSFGSKTFGEFLFGPVQQITYRFVATATPSPNEFQELIAYSHFLGIMDIGQARTRFFKRNSEKSDDLTLHKHKEKEFWLWVASWALFLQKPSDLGFDDTGYDLPELRVHLHEIPVDHLKAAPDKRGQGLMFRNATAGVAEASREKRDTLDARVAKMSEILWTAPDDHFLIWHDLEDERRAIEREVPKSVSVYGSQDLDKREQAIIDFSEGKLQYLAAKPVIAGSGCNFQRHCHKAVFLGIGYKFNDFIQAIHRIHRFLQSSAVDIHIIYAESEKVILQVLLEKWDRDKEQRRVMSEIIRKYGLSHEALNSKVTRTYGVERQERSGEMWRCINNDSVLECRQMESNSMGMVLTSIPFSTQYEYTPSYNDFGHTDDNDHFFEQMDFLTPELLRILKPGRIAAVHVKDRVVPSGMTGLGFQVVYDFHNDVTQHFKRHGFHFMGMITIVTDVVKENNQTYRLGHGEQLKDGTKMGVGLPEYLLLFRKAPTENQNSYADEPVVKAKQDYNLARWQIDAHGFWRSNGNRLFTPEELKTLSLSAIMRRFKNHSLTTVYDFEEHVKLGEGLKEANRLRTDWMVIPPQSWNENVWTDVTRIRTLNTVQAQKNRVKHLCPLQFDIVDRAITKHTMPGETVFDPFAGLMTVPYRAVLLGRRGVGVELNQDYWRDGVIYCESAEVKQKSPSLFEMFEEETDVPE